MSVVTVQANKNLAVLIAGPFTTTVNCTVESEFVTTVFCLDAANLAAFRSGQNYTYWGDNTPQTNHRKTVILPHLGTWYLVIINYNPWPTAVYHTVSS